MDDGTVQSSRPVEKPLPTTKQVVSAFTDYWTGEEKEKASGELLKLIELHAHNRQLVHFVKCVITAAQSVEKPDGLPYRFFTTFCDQARNLETLPLVELLEHASGTLQQLAKASESDSNSESLQLRVALLTNFLAVISQLLGCRTSVEVLRSKLRQRVSSALRGAFTVCNSGNCDENAQFALLAAVYAICKNEVRIASFLGDMEQQTASLLARGDKKLRRAKRKSTSSKPRDVFHAANFLLAHAKARQDTDVLGRLFQLNLDLCCEMDDVRRVADLSALDVRDEDADAALVCVLRGALCHALRMPDAQRPPSAAQFVDELLNTHLSSVRLLLDDHTLLESDWLHRQIVRLAESAAPVAFGELLGLLPLPYINNEASTQLGYCVLRRAVSNARFSPDCVAALGQLRVASPTFDSAITLHAFAQTFVLDERELQWDSLETLEQLVFNGVHLLVTAAWSQLPSDSRFASVCNNVRETLAWLRTQNNASAYMFGAALLRFLRSGRQLDAIGAECQDWFERASASNPHGVYYALQCCSALRGKRHASVVPTRLLSASIGVIREQLASSECRVPAVFLCLVADMCLEARRHGAKRARVELETNDMNPVETIFKLQREWLARRLAQDPHSALRIWNNAPETRDLRALFSSFVTLIASGTVRDELRSDLLDVGKSAMDAACGTGRPCAHACAAADTLLAVHAAKTFSTDQLLKTLTVLDGRLPGDSRCLQETLLAICTLRLLAQLLKTSGEYLQVDSPLLVTALGLLTGLNADTFKDAIGVDTARSCLPFGALFAAYADCLVALAPHIPNAFHVHLLAKCVENMLLALVRLSRSDWLESLDTRCSAADTVRACAFELQRVLDTANKTKKDTFGKVAPFVIAEYVHTLASPDETMPADLRAPIQQCVFRLFDASDYEVLASVNLTLRPILRPVFKKLFEDYDRLFKYTQRV